MSSIILVCTSELIVNYFGHLGHFFHVQGYLSLLVMQKSVSLDFVIFSNTATTKVTALSDSIDI